MGRLPLLYNYRKRIFMALDLTMQGEWVPKNLIYRKMIATGRRASDVFALYLAVYGMRSVLDIDVHIDAAFEYCSRRGAGRRGSFV